MVEGSELSTSGYQCAVTDIGDGRVDRSEVF